MNNTVKIVAIAMIAIMLLLTSSQIVFATPTDVITDMDTADYQSDKLSNAGVTSIAQSILSAIRNISVIVAVVMISILGVQYMVGSAEQKASYKKAFIPLIVGAILVVAAAQIATMLFSIK